MIVNNELEWAFTAEVVAYCTVLLRHIIWWVGVQVPAGARFSRFLILSRPALGPVGTAGDFSENKGAGAWTYRFPSTTMVKNVEAISPLPHMYSWHGALLIKHRDNFTISTHSLFWLLTINPNFFMLVEAPLWQLVSKHIRKVLLSVGCAFWRWSIVVERCRGKLSYSHITKTKLN
jgi:hypothetical protein